MALADGDLGGAKAWRRPALASVLALLPVVGVAQARQVPPSPDPAGTARPADQAQDPLKAGTLPIPTPAPDARLPVVEPIIPDDEFNAAIPRLDPRDDPELSKPLESIDAFEQNLARSAPGPAPAASPASAATAMPAAVPEPIGSAPIRDAELTKPLPPLSEFKLEQTTFAEPEPDTTPVEIAYTVHLTGLSAVDVQTGVDLDGEFAHLSALHQGKGHAANLAQLSSRLGEDAALLRKLLSAEGWFDAQVATRIDRPQAQKGQPIAAVIDVAPGKRFAFASIAVRSDPTMPPDLMRSNLPLQVGEPVVAARVIGAEANLALALPQHGYPFARLDQRDVLLDRDSGGADYTLPVELGPRGRFGRIVSDGKEAFGADHVAVLARFKPGELYDSRMVDDLRQALIASNLFSAVAVEPRRTGITAADGTDEVELAVHQQAGPPRTIALSGGYSAGQGFRAEGSWTHRNLFPPEGALIISGVSGTQEQSAGLVFRRADAGQRDRTFEMAAELAHSVYDAFNAYTGRLSARVSRDSTPLWQKRVTYAYGAQLIGSNESVFDPAVGTRVRRTYAIAGLTGQLGFDTTDSLLDPGKGYRLTVLAEPEGSLRRQFSPYVRLRGEGTAYQRFGNDLILAGRVLVASIQGAALDDLAPSRRLYGGGGGSVRGFAYQQLGPHDIEGNPTGGRSLNEASLELRYRFGDYGIAAFADVGQVYQSNMPRFTNLRTGVGIGGRIYTNFGPMRIDLATPLKRRAGESRINVYVSIGQAF